MILFSQEALVHIWKKTARILTVTMCTKWPAPSWMITLLSLNIPLENLILTYQQISTTALRITIAAKDTNAPVLTDIRRITIFNTSSVESLTLNNTTISTRTVLDDLMYTQSQESHCLTIRQQNPIIKLWSLCEIHSFSSNGGARTSVWVQWNEVDVSYEVPTS
mgnify:CR=1 FL=1